MRGTSSWQIHEVFKSIDSIGAPGGKHSAKSEARDAAAALGEKVTWATMDLNIHGVATNDAYRDVAKTMAEFARAEYGVRDIMCIKAEHTEAFMVKVINSGGPNGGVCARSTANVYHSALAKFEKALNTYAAQKNLPLRDLQIKGTPENQARGSRAYAADQCGPANRPDRAYASPTALTQAIQGKHQLLGNALRESGARISEMSTIRAESLKGIKTFPDGSQKGEITLKGKGGNFRPGYVSTGTYDRIVIAVAAGGGRASWSEDKFRTKQQAAAVKTNQPYNGPHGLRHNYAQDRMRDLQAAGMSFLAGLGEVSRSMGHERSDITLTYIGT